jgi:hypothetical protein
MSIDAEMAVDSSARIALSASDGLLARPRRIAAVGSAPVLGLMVALSAVIRSIGATAHSAPTIFPDEYIYTALARSLGSSGRPLIRGAAAHFPALLEPLFAAPIWALAPTATAYHLVQIENAVFISLAAVPVYLLARALAFRGPYALACALFAVVIPDGAFAGRTLADPVAYPLALTAFYLGVLCLQRSSRSREIAFLACAFIAAFARVQYVVLIPAFLCALLVTRRGHALRSHRLSLTLLVGGALAALSLGPSRILGYYSVVANLHVGRGMVDWAVTDLFLLAIAGGVVLVPGALVGLASARGPKEVPFAVFTGFYTLALIVAAGLYASNGAGRFQERYLFSILPLIPVAFGLFLRHGRPARVAVLVICAVLVLVAMRVPLSGFAASTGSNDSPLLWAVVRLNNLVSLGTSSLLVAVYVAIAGTLAGLVAFGLRARVAFGATIIFLVAASLGATSADLSNVRLSRVQFVSPNPTWVDDAKVGNVTAVATPLANTGLLTEQLYWNRSIDREVVLAGADPTDAFAASPVNVARDGTLTTSSGPLRAPILFEQFGATARFQQARLVAQTSSFALWKPTHVARLELLETGRYHDGWLGASGGLTVWPKPGKRLHGTLTFVVTLPYGFKPTALTFGGRTATIRPGTARRFSFCIDTNRPWKRSFNGVPHFLPDFRVVSVKQTTPRFAQGGACHSPTGS